MNRELIALAKKKGASNSDIEKILDKKAKSMSRSGINRRYRDLLRGRFEINDVRRIERKEEGNNDIFGKAFDFSYRSIRDLRDEGYQHALAQLK
jgi:hypothetical protein